MLKNKTKILFVPFVRHIELQNFLIGFIRSTPPSKKFVLTSLSNKLHMISRRWVKYWNKNFAPCIQHRQIRCHSPARRHHQYKSGGKRASTPNIPVRSPVGDSHSSTNRGLPFSVHTPHNSTITINKSHTHIHRTQSTLPLICESGIFGPRR